MTGSDEALAAIGYLSGDDRVAGRLEQDAGLAVAGSTNTYWLHMRRPKRLHIPRNYLRLSTGYQLDRYPVLVNLVTDPDQNPKVLAVVATMLKKYRGIVINAPAAVAGATREGMARRLAGTPGLIVPAVARFPGKPGPAAAAIDRAGVTFPAILRRPGTHGGQSMAIMADRAAALAAIGGGGDNVLTSYVDLRWPDGFYRKLRVFFFARRGVLRHRLIAPDWNVHARHRKTMAPWMIAEERAMIEQGYAGLPAAARNALDALAARVPLDFFGVDFGLGADGRVVLFEANATMNFFPFSDDPAFAYMATVEAEGRSAFRAMLSDALARSPIRIAVDV